MLVSRQFKLMLLVNAFLGFLFIITNFIYDYFGNMPSHHALWSPLSIIFYNYTFPSIGAVEPNFSFYFFWVLMIVNMYFLFRLQKSNQTKQNPS